MHFSGIALALSLGASAAAANIPSLSASIQSVVGAASSSAMSSLKAYSSAASSASSSASKVSSTSASVSSAYAATSASRLSQTVSASSVGSSASSVISSASSVIKSASSVSSSASAEATAEPIHGDIFTCNNVTEAMFGACCDHLLYFSNGEDQLMLAPQECVKAALNETSADDDHPTYKCTNSRIFGRCCLEEDGLKTCNEERPIQFLSSFDDKTGFLDYTSYFPGYTSTSHDMALGGTGSDDE